MELFNKKNNKFFICCLILFIIFSFFLEGCNDNDDSDSSNNNDNSTTNASVETINYGDFSSKTPRTASRESRENSDGKPGTDSDNDKGYVCYITPERYWVAFKSVAYVRDDGTKVYLFNKEKLIDSLVIEFTKGGTIKGNFPRIENVPAGHYGKLYFEIYYYQLKMKVHDKDRIIRVYMSDDDFPQEGNLGHHQGDILYIDEATNNILGWVNGGEWKTYSTTRNDTHNGAGGTDPQTNHSRGYFGDEKFWNSDELMQGPYQDIYILERDIDLTIESNSNPQIIIIHALKNLWFFEDFDNNQAFTPGGKSPDALYREAAEIGAEWAPIFPRLRPFIKPNYIEKEEGRWSITFIETNEEFEFTLDKDGVITEYISKNNEDKNFDFTPSYCKSYDVNSRNFEIILLFNGGKDEDDGYTEILTGTVKEDNSISGTWKREYERGDIYSGNFTGKINK